MKLRVGDIEMDSEGGVELHRPASVRPRGRGAVVSHVVVTGAGRTGGPQPGTPSPLSHPTTREPSPARLRLVGWLGLGGAAVAAGAVFFALPATSPLALGLSLPILGLFAGGLVARRVAGRVERERARLQAAQDDALATPVEAVLRGATEPLTVETLTERAGAPEAEVVRGLARLVERGRATEDLDLDTGHFVYRWGSDLLDAETPPEALDIRDRAARLESPQPHPTDPRGLP